MLVGYAITLGLERGFGKGCDNLCKYSPIRMRFAPNWIGIHYCRSTSERSLTPTLPSLCLDLVNTPNA